MRDLKKRGLSGTPYALAFEYSAKEQLHLHGVAVVVAGEGGKAFRDALRAAGGDVGKRAAARQVKIDRAYNGARWGSYSWKNVKRVQKVLSGDARPFLNRDMTRLAKWHSVAR